MIDTETLQVAVPFWNDLSEHEQRELASIASSRIYAAGENIHDANTACIGVFFLLSGSARAYMLSEEGRQITLFRINTNESCVLSASCVLPLITFDILVEATEETELVILPSDYYGALMDKNKSVESYTYKEATVRFSEVMWVMQQQLFMKFDKRLAIFLLDEVARTSSERICLTHEEIARNIGSAREVVTRTLKQFTAEDIIEPFRGGLLIKDKARLRSLSVE